MTFRIRPFWIALAISMVFLPAFAQSTRPPQQPDPRLTPGDVLEVGVRDICVVGYTKKVRNVPESVKKKVYAEYGILTHQPGEYEVDHLISLELGGSNSIRNLWPQSYLTAPYNAHIKDTLENKLHRMVCNGQMDLRTAQREIAVDWIGAYHRYVLGQTQGPLASNQRRATPRNSQSASTYQPPPQPDYGQAPTYSRSSGKTGAGRPAPQEPVEVTQEEPPPYYRVPVRSRRQQSKRCKLKNLWCGFGLLK